MKTRTKKKQARPSQRSSAQVDLLSLLHDEESDGILRARAPAIRAFLGDGIIADNFAGGGGVSEGLGDVFGREPDIAINHDAEAIAMHKANHPTTTHYTESVWKVDPRKACRGRRVALAWFSPDCRDHSKAKGGKPVNRKVRGLAWSAVRWAQLVRPDVICLENVEEFRDWGPCVKVRCEKSEASPDGWKLVRDPKRKGQTFRSFVRKLERLGYTVEWKLLRACDYGAPTTRRRFFLIARRDGRAIRWPLPTHGPGTSRPYRTAAECIDFSIPCPSIFDRKKPLRPKTLARIVRGIVKFVLENPRPFVIPVNHGAKSENENRATGVDAPLPTVTSHGRGSHAVVTPIVTKFQQNSSGQDAQVPLDSVMAGATRFGVVTPHLVPYYGERRDGEKSRARGVDEPLATQTTENRFAVVAPIVMKTKTHGGGGNNAKGADEPIGTITTSKRGEFAVGAAYLIHRSNGERKGQAPRVYDPKKPLGTVVAGGQKHAVCVANLIKHHGGHESKQGGQSLDEPVHTIATRDQKAVSVTHLIRFQGTSESHLGSSASGMDEPVPSITAQGEKIAQVTALLMKFYGKSTGSKVDHPIDTITTKDRYAVVTVEIDGETYAIVDIGMRMLTPRELFRAQGFPDSYQISPDGPNGKPLTRTAQVRMCGNSVPPPMVTALVGALAEAA